MTKLKGSNGKAYTGCEKGGLFAVFNDKDENVGNFADEAAAVELGGYEIVGGVESQAPEGTTNDSSAKTETDGEGSPGATQSDGKNEVPAGANIPTGEGAQGSTEPAPE